MTTGVASTTGTSTRAVEARVVRDTAIAAPPSESEGAGGPSQERRLQEREADADRAAPATTRPATRIVRPDLKRERRLWRDGHEWVAGLDEVGRGAWAGPVSVGIVVVHTRARQRSVPTWLRDSKVLAEERRESLFPQVARWCVDGAVGHASAAECDLWGMTAALRLAGHRALAALELRPDALLMDGPFDYLQPRPVPPEGPPPRGADVPLPSVTPPSTVIPVVDGDACSAAVAAASVLAKVVRDRIMREESRHYPAYSFERNKGYPSGTHQRALRGYGLSAIHRRSWTFVEDLPWR